MVIATHLIKIKGDFDVRKWTEKKLEEYVRQKIKEIDSSFHTDLELFQIQDNNIKVWVYISALPSEVSDKIVGDWIKTHLKEEGIETKEFKIKVIFNITESLKADSPRQVTIRLP
ncbi:hypothetical protein KKD57_05600 [Patescibacteria group bacterium]|nr:hypothetical protein [Patescibacteria group bacterium]MBU4480756.1 hypothetical protein [Patescibacteria group bacterium]